MGGLKNFLNRTQGKGIEKKPKQNPNTVLANLGDMTRLMDEMSVNSGNSEPAPSVPNHNPIEVATAAVSCVLVAPGLEDQWRQRHHRFWYFALKLAIYRQSGRQLYSFVLPPPEAPHLYSREEDGKFCIFMEMPQTRAPGSMLFYQIDRKCGPLPQTDLNQPWRAAVRYKAISHEIRHTFSDLMPNYWYRLRAVAFARDGTMGTCSREITFTTSKKIINVQ